MITNVSLTRPRRAKGSPPTARAWGWSQWGRQNRTALQRERQNQSNVFDWKSQQRVHVENSNNRKSKIKSIKVTSVSRVVSWPHHVASGNTADVSLLRITRMLLSQSLKSEFTYSTGLLLTGGLHYTESAHTHFICPEVRSNTRNRAVKVFCTYSRYMSRCWGGRACNILSAA